MEVLPATYNILIADRSLEVTSSIKVDNFDIGPYKQKITLAATVSLIVRTALDCKDEDLSDDVLDDLIGRFRTRGEEY